MAVHIVNSYCCSADVELGAEIILHGIEDFINLNQTEDLLYFTHSDHLGSSSFISDLSGEAVQHLQYLPFGESFVTQTSSTWQTRYTFSGKEKDIETGYSYFGARYYDSELSVWLSVDPMSDKYPNQSAYSYVGGRPINVIDPNGEDEWELDNQGNVVNRIENKDHDSFHIVEKDKDGNYQRVANSEEYAKGTVKSQKNPNGMTLFEIQGDENAKEIFEFFGNNYTQDNGRPTEWTHAKIGTEKSGKNIVGTSHDKSSTKVGHYLRLSKYTLREVNHNHPTNNPSPSWDQSNGASNSTKGDVPMAKKYEKLFPNIILKIYTPKYGYSPYDSHGTLDERILKGEIPR